MMKRLILLLVSISVLLPGLNSCNYDRPLRRELLKIWNEDKDSRTEWNGIFQKYGEGGRQVDSIIKVIQHLDSIHLAKIASSGHQIKSTIANANINEQFSEQLKMYSLSRFIGKHHFYKADWEELDQLIEAA